MAVVRCRKCGMPRGITREYSGEAMEPIGYPDTAAICGRTGCYESGLVWLETQEWQAYQNGERVFCIPNQAVKIRTQ